jgi:predicted ribosome quality control (RQC) complex YloA/Tae2 family protein
MTDVKLDVGKSVEQNASALFERSKKLRSKSIRAKDAVAKMRAQLDRIPETARPKRRVRAIRKKVWYEKFRWFVSSEGFLVVGGRDAVSNEIVIKKHTAPDDLVLHTDMAGSPFFVIKAEGRVPGEQTVMEAADATATFGRAWRRGLPYADVFCVKPHQVSKDAQPGEFLPKGAFMIRGKTSYVENKVNLAIGIHKEAVMAGPVTAVKTHCDVFVEIVQGDRKTSDVAKAVRRQVGGELDDIIRAMPAGGCDIRGRK